MPENQPLPLAVIGCGAISESYYFPALATLPALQASLWLVEPDRARGAQCAAKFGFNPAQLAASIDELPGTIRGAINATPSHLHVPTTHALLARGIGAIVEKPLAETADEAQGMVDAAAAAGCVLTVNQFRRLWPSYKLIAEALRSGTLGTVQRITWREGRKFEWPVRTGFMFRRPWSGRPRGALLDMGVHLLDTICWWLDAQPTVLESRMDGLGGPEAFVSGVAEANGTRIEIAASFLVKLENEYLIEGSKGAIRGATADYSRYQFKAPGGAWKTVSANDAADRVEIARRMIENFAAAIEGKAPVLIDAASAVRPLRMIDQMYRSATDIVPECYREWMPEQEMRGAA